MRIDINGEIVGNGQKFCDGDFCPQDFRDAIENLKENEQVDIHITSPGGNVIDGNVIVSIIKDLQSNGHKVNSYIHGIAASMASVVACACDELHIDSNAVMMIHLPFSCVQGNSNDMKKEASLLEMMTKTLVSIYKTKFNKSDDEIVQMLSQETWILGEEANSFGLNCIVDNSSSDRLMIAAKYKKIFKNIPRGFIDMETKEEEITKENGEQKIDETVNEEKTSTGDEQKVEEEKVKEKIEEEKIEEKVEEQMEKEEKKQNEDEEVLTKEEVIEKFAEYETKIEELVNQCEKLKNENEELKRELAECNKPIEDRLSGLQSSLQKNFNAKLNELTTELQAKKQELTSIKNDVISLSSKLDEKEVELSKVVSALQKKSHALDALNGAVNEQAIELPNMLDGLAKCMTPAQKVAFLKSEKYVR